MDTITGLATDERTARIALAVLVAPDDPVTGRMVDQVGAVETVRLLTTDGPVPTMDQTGAALWRRRLPFDASPDAVIAALRATEEFGCPTLIPGDNGFPSPLGDLGDRLPYVLWVKGAGSLLTGRIEDRFTITGARAASSYGENVAHMLASDLASEEKVLVSGGAYGIDAAVHRAALASGGHTVAVLPGGIDRPHPAAHRELLECTGDLGLLITEFPPGALPTRSMFLARARIEAALSGSTTIVEAAGRSGAMPVAQWAHELGRVVGAVPGPVTSATSYGPHRLLQSGTASLVTDAADLMDLVDRGQATATTRRVARDQLSPGQERPAPAVGTPSRSM